MFGLIYAICHMVFEKVSSISNLVFTERQNVRNTKYTLTCCSVMDDDDYMIEDYTESAKEFTLETSLLEFYDLFEKKKSTYLFVRFDSDYDYKEINLY